MLHIIQLTSDNIRPHNSDSSHKPVKVLSKSKMSSIEMRKRVKLEDVKNVVVPSIKYTQKSIKARDIKWFEKPPFTLSIVKEDATKYIALNQYFEIYIGVFRTLLGLLLYGYFGSSARLNNSVGVRAREHDRDFPNECIWTTLMHIQVIPDPGYDGEDCAKFAEKWATIYLKLVCGVSVIKGSNWCRESDLNQETYKYSNVLRYFFG